MKGKFFTAINCMDGRVQLPVIDFLKKQKNVDYVDMITEPGPILILAEQKNNELINSIIERTKVSVDIHKSTGIAIVGHYDCAGNPVDKNTQVLQTKTSIEFMQSKFPNIAFMGLWVDENWVASQI